MASLFQWPLNSLQRVVDTRYPREKTIRLFIWHLVATWEETPLANIPHYYDMREKRYTCIDGSQFGNLASEIGLEGTGFPAVMRSILRGVNRMELKEE